jgi:hypothetical protein
MEGFRLRSHGLKTTEDAPAEPQKTTSWEIDVQFAIGRSLVQGRLENSSAHAHFQGSRIIA